MRTFLVASIIIFTCAFSIQSSNAATEFCSSGICKPNPNGIIDTRRPLYGPKPTTLCTIVNNWGVQAVASVVAGMLDVKWIWTFIPTTVCHLVGWRSEVQMAVSLYDDTNRDCIWDAAPHSPLVRLARSDFRFSSFPANWEAALRVWFSQDTPRWAGYANRVWHEFSLFLILNSAHYSPRKASAPIELTGALLDT